MRDGWSSDQVRFHPSLIVLNTHMLMLVEQPMGKMQKIQKRLQVFLLLTLSGIPLVWISGTMWKSDSDDLNPTLISIENWRFLFWGNSRFGTLVPLLAKPFTDMKTNLLIQNFIHAISLTIFIYAVMKTLYRNDGKESIRKYIFLVLVFFFLLTNYVYLELLISGLPYAAPLGLFGLSLLLVNSKLSKKIVVPTLVVLCALSCWVNPLQGFYLAPFLVLLIALKNFKSIYYELLLFYLLFTFGLFFIVLGLANGEISGTVTPSFKAFGFFNWWLSLFLIQVGLFILGLFMGNIKKNYAIYLSFAVTWISVFALSSLRHIYFNAYAPRYFITATFISMCVTMYLVTISLKEILNIQDRSSGWLKRLIHQRTIAVALVSLLISNIFIVNHLLSDIPLKQPQKRLLSTLFLDSTSSYKFAAGDFWYTWPTKLYVDNPEEIFVTSFMSENQYDVSTDSIQSVRSRLADGDLGLCFGDIKDCESQIKLATFRMYGLLEFRIEIVDVRFITDTPITVSEMRLRVTSK
jgi:hypothetical protein